jgi:thiol:disulfide interchange protein DsbD
MGAALGLALTGSTTTMLLIFVALRHRHGLALRPARVVPRLATAASPPRPWLERFKQTLAFPLYGR